MTNKAKIFLVANQKGGCGKTTLTINLATASAFDGKKNVLILDCDPQRTAFNWQMAAEQNPRVFQFEFVLPQVVAAEKEHHLPSVIAELESDFDEIWIDSAGYFGDDDDAYLRQIMEQIVPLVDIFVMPIKTDVFTIWSTRDTIKFFDKRFAENIKPTAKMFLLPTAIPNKTRGVENMYSILDEELSSMENPKLHWEKLSCYIPNSIPLANSLANGGNAFVPVKIRGGLSDYFSNSLIEIYKKSGMKIEKVKRNNLNDKMKSLKAIRLEAKKEKEQYQAEQNSN